MALKRNERYPGRFENPTAAQPQGAFKNRTSPTSQDGSYLEADWVNDWSGFFGRLLTAGSITANGNVDTALDSQYYSALIAAVKSELGTAARRNVGTGSNNIPDMTSFVSNDNAQAGWNILPNGHISQYGTATLTTVGTFNPVTVAGITYYTHYYLVNLPRAYPTAHISTVVSLAGYTFDQQTTEYGSWVNSNRTVTTGGSVSLTQFVVSVTSSNASLNPVIHYKSEGY